MKIQYEDNMESLWNEFSTLEKVFAVTGAAFSLFFILQMLLSFFGGDHDHDASGDSDASMDHDAGIPFQFITLKNLVAFFTIMGWTGLLCLREGMSTGLSIIISVFAGLLMMTIMAIIFYYMSKLADQGNIKDENAIGKNAEVYLRIPAQRQASGKISVTVQGRLMEYAAITDDDEDIMTGSMVKVIEKVGQQSFLVTKNK